MPSKSAKAQKRTSPSVQTAALAEKIESFRQDPTQQGVFDELNTALKNSDPATLAELYEFAASVETTPEREEALWLSAAQLHRQVEDFDGAFHDYLQILQHNPSHKSAAELCFTMLCANERYTEAADVVAAEIEALEEIAATEPSIHPRLADRHRAAARIWQDHLGRLDRALLAWQRSFTLEPLQTEALEQSRTIYASLGDEKMVVQLYETELQLLGDSGDRRKRANIELALGGLMHKRANTHGAAEHLESALELAPESIDVRESLAEVLATFDDASNTRRASELFVEIGKQKFENADHSGAISYLRRALGVDPTSQTGSDNLESVLKIARRWGDLDRLYQQRLTQTNAPQERANLLVQRAHLCENELDDRVGLKECFKELSSLYGPGNEYSNKLRTLYEDDQEGEQVVALLEVEIAAKEDRDPEKIRLLLDLATVHREQLNDRDMAAETLHRVLGLDALNAEALQRYTEHFRQRRDWRGLTDLQEYTVEQLTEQGAATATLVERLESIAELCEVRLGDIERAIATWKRIQELEGHAKKSSEALQRLMSRAKMWESLVGVLEQEAEQATSPESRAEALCRIAQVYRERQVNPRRAIALYEEVYGLFPNDPNPLKALGELYEREGDDAGLANTIRRQLTLAAQVQAAQSEGPIQWPSTLRVERLTALRRLANMYERDLADVEGVVFSCSGILELLPGDRDALERMGRVLEKAGDTERLEQTLEYHVACSTAPIERSKLLRRLAKLAEDRDDEFTAMERWEQVLRAAPSDYQALRQLADLYEKHQRHSELADVLERSLAGAKIPNPGSAEAAELAAEFKRLARVLDFELHATARATRAWIKVLEISERDRDALASLCRIYEKAKQWRELTGVLSKQIPLYLNEPNDVAADLALRRATILEERLGAPELATKALEELIAKVNPRSLDAHRRLRRLYEARGAFESAIRIAEREMVLTEDLNAKINRGLEIGILCRDRINNHKRALQSYERVLQLDPIHPEAMKAACDLYAKVGKWRAYVALLERRIENTEDETGTPQQALMLDIANANAEHLGAPQDAFFWYCRAHQLAPSATTLGIIRESAARFGLWKELLDVFDADRARLSAGQVIELPEQYIELCREIAHTICHVAPEVLRDPKRAANALFDALRVDPLSELLLTEIESIARTCDEPEVWDILLQCFELPLAAVSGEARISLLLRRAQLREDHSEDPRGACDDLLRAFSWAPGRGDIRERLYAFGDRQFAQTSDRQDRNFWPSILSVETALAERAPNQTEQVAILRRKAKAYEERSEDLVRGFRTHLSAFLCKPDDEETVAHLWRLARKIGKYQESDRTPQEEPPAATIGDAFQKPTALPTTTRLAQSSAAPRMDQTLELNIGDLRDLRDPTQELDLGDLQDFAHNQNNDRTQELDIHDLMGNAAEEGELQDVQIHQPSAERNDATMEIRTEDLIEALGRKTTSTPPMPRPPIPGQTAPTNGPPPPPPKRPKIQPLFSTKSQAVGIAPSQPQKVRRPSAPKLPKLTRRARQSHPPVPTAPKRAYSSPWSELSTVYCQMPAATQADRLRWYYKAAEIWELGANEIHRSFAVLAKALRNDPGNSETRDRLFQLATAHNEWNRLAQLFEGAAELADSAQGAADFLMLVATIRTTQGRTKETESLYRRVLGMLPNDVSAREQLEELYRSEERWIDLAAQLEERTDPRLGSAAPIAERSVLLRELAQLYSEELSRPHDAIDTLERLLELQPQNIDLLQEVANQYSALGSWSKVITTLTQVSDLTEGHEGKETIGLDCLRRIGEIYQTELMLPERAIAAFAKLLERNPKDDAAFGILAPLYETHARWEELAELLQRRAGMSRDPNQRAKLLHRRARILMDWCKSPEEAANTLRLARAIDPANSKLASDLTEALQQAGKTREAASVLDERIAHLRENNGSSGDIAALLVRLAGLRGQSLGDSKGAIGLLEEALVLVPAHPTALATLSQLTHADQNPKAHAQAKLRQAEAFSDIDAKVQALLEAGKSFRDSGDNERAHAAYSSVLQHRPYHAEATWSLAALIESGGQVDEAIALLSKQLNDGDMTAEERAGILTQLAALSQQAGVESAAERRYEEAIEQVPSHLPAIMGLADLYGCSGRWPELVRFLNRKLPELDDSDSATQAELLRRLATGYEGMDEADEAYQTLIKADRKHRNTLLIKLALGENRYKARRWREAAMHLCALVDHPDAPQHPSSVAEGLYHAALAEIRSLRPDKAEDLYHAAIRLKDDYRPALHALAEIAIERGDQTEAIAFLGKQAHATDNPNERLELFESLGDMVMDKLQDPAQAKIYFESAVNAASPLESKHTDLLSKLLLRQISSGDRAGAGQSCEFLASFSQDASERSERFTEAAQHFIDAEMTDRARAAADRAVEANAFDLAACEIASELALLNKDHAAVAASLGRLLKQRSEKPDTDLPPHALQSFALLWSRLGSARQARGDIKDATQCFETALKESPDSVGAMNARRGLIEIWGEKSKSDRLLQFYRQLANHTLYRDDVLGYARALGRAGQKDAARTTLELAGALGHENSKEDVAFLARHRVRIMAEDEAYKHPLSQNSRQILLAEAAEIPKHLAKICTTLWQSAPLLWPDLPEAFARCAIADAQRITSTDSIRAAAIFTRIARALDAPATILYTTDSSEAPDIQVVCVSPPVIVFGPRLIQNEDAVSDLELRFLLARAADLARPESILATGLGDSSFQALMASVLRNFGTGAIPATPEEQKFDTELRTTLPVRVRTDLEQCFAQGPKVTLEDVASYVQACLRSSERAGLVICGDIATALRYTLKHNPGADREHLLHMALHPEYAVAREQLGIGVLGTD